MTASSARGVKSTYRSKCIIFILINNYYIALGTAKVTPKESEVTTVAASSARGVKSTRSKYTIFIFNNYYIALGTATVTPKESEVSTVTASSA